MDFQPLFNLDGLVTYNSPLSPPRPMMISVDQQLSTCDSQTFRLSDGMPISSSNVMDQDTRMTFSEMADPWDDFPIDRQLYCAPYHNIPVCGHCSQESKNMEIGATALNTQSINLDVNVSDFYESRQVSTENMLMKYMNLTTSDDPSRMESSGVEELELNSEEILDKDMAFSTDSTMASTPEITTSDITNPPSPAPVQTPAITSSLKRMTRLSVKYERPDHSARRLKKPLLVCQFCDKQFRNNSSLKQHIAFHLPQRPFICECSGCENTYKSKSELNRHMVTHGDKNYKCLKCNKSFLRKLYLKTHLIRYHEGLTWHCSLCAKICVSEAELDKHKITYHKIRKRSSHLGGRHSSRFATEDENEDSL